VLPQAKAAFFERSSMSEHTRAPNRSQFTGLLMVLTPFSGQPVLLTGLLLSAMLAIKLVGRQRSA
jgi:hypothetical protein